MAGSPRRRRVGGCAQRHLPAGGPIGPSGPTGLRTAAIDNVRYVELYMLFVCIVVIYDDDCDDYVMLFALSDFVWSIEQCVCIHTLLACLYIVLYHNGHSKLLQCAKALSHFAYEM